MNKGKQTKEELKSQIESLVKELNDRNETENGWGSDKYVFVKAHDTERDARLTNLIDFVLRGLTDDAEKVAFEGPFDLTRAILRGETQLDKYVPKLNGKPDEMTPRVGLARLFTKVLREHLCHTVSRRGSVTCAGVWNEDASASAG
jgi:hypothetical protein